MMMQQSPRCAPEGSRSRYAHAFTSTIFEAAGDAPNARFVPQGKRRDQTTSELFGNYEEKDLRGMPKTFVPKEDGLSARQKKLNFLSSEVLPCSTSAAWQEEGVYSSPIKEQGSCAEATYEGEAPIEDEAAPVCEEDDTCLRRHMELSSKLFGRKTPQVTTEQANDRRARLTPNDFTWHSHPEPVHSPKKGMGMSHVERAYREKCSGLFDHRSPETADDFHEEKRLAREEADMGKMRRQNNAQYSDLFGRDVGAAPEASPVVRRPKFTGSYEDRIAVHQDWTDSKTELLGDRSQRGDQPNYQRKSDELHQSRIFGQKNVWQPNEKVKAVTHDNADKVKSTFGRTTQEIHQAHLRTSIHPDGFYEEAENTKHWEVVELHVSGLASTENDATVRHICRGCDLHIVRATAEMDPVRNLCRGRAKIMVRYNPTRDSIAGLVDKLEKTGLKVEL